MSNTLTEATWENSSVINGDVAAELTKLKADTRLGTTGSATLVRWLLEQRPGRRTASACSSHRRRSRQEALRRRPTVPLKLLSSTTFDTGVLHLVYAAADND